MYSIFTGVNMDGRATLVYAHNLDSYVLGEHNCLTIPAEDVMRNGMASFRGMLSIDECWELLRPVFIEQFNKVDYSIWDW